jgi:hypothetical protein
VFSLCSRCVLVVFSLCTRCVLVVFSLCSRCVLVVFSLCSRCVTSSTDQIMNRHAWTTLKVIRTCILIILFDVHLQRPGRPTLTLFFDLMLLRYQRWRIVQRRWGVGGAGLLRQQQHGSLWCFRTDGDGECVHLHQHAVLAGRRTAVRATVVVVAMWLFQNATVFGGWGFFLVVLYFFGEQKWQKYFLIFFDFFFVLFSFSFFDNTTTNGLIWQVPGKRRNDPCLLGVVRRWTRMAHYVDRGQSTGGCQCVQQIQWCVFCLWCSWCCWLLLLLVLLLLSLGVLIWICKVHGTPTTTTFVRRRIDERKKNDRFKSLDDSLMFILFYL